MANIPSVKLSTGVDLPVIGLGMFEIKGPSVEVAINAAIEAGYRHFDTALLYENEKLIGDALRKKINDGTVRREDIIVTTKLYNTDHHPDKVEPACREAVERFNLGYIDLYIMHWPMVADVLDQSGTPDDSVDYLDTWKAMQSLVDKGYVRSIGVSNFNHKQLERILACTDLKHKPVCNQIEVSPYLTNDKLLQFCKSHNIAVIAYCPIGSGNSPWNKGFDPVLLKEPILSEIGNKYNKTAAQVALRWGVQRGYAMIPKSATPSRIRENMQVFDFSLTDDDMTAISKLNRNYRFVPFDNLKNSIYYPFNEEY